MAQRIAVIGSLNGGLRHGCRCLFRHARWCSAEHAGADGGRVAPASKTMTMRIACERIPL